MGLRAPLVRLIELMPSSPPASRPTLGGPTSPKRNPLLPSRGPLRTLNVTVLRESSASSGRQIYYAPRCDFSRRCHVLALEEASRAEGYRKGDVDCGEQGGRNGGTSDVGTQRLLSRFAVSQCVKEE